MLIEVIKCCVPVHLFLFGLLFCLFYEKLISLWDWESGFFAFLEQELFDPIVGDRKFHKSQP